MSITIPSRESSDPLPVDDDEDPFFDSVDELEESLRAGLLRRGLIDEWAP